MNTETAVNNENHNNVDAGEQVAYAKDTFNIKKQMGEKFVPNFIKKNNLQELCELIRSSIDLSKEKHNRSVVISVCSEKGGVGKTTTAIILGQLLVNLGFKTLVVDTDTLRASSKILTSRIQAIHDLVLDSQESNTSEADVIEKKKKLDPVVDTISVDVKTFNASYIEDLAATNHYEVIIIDTAGRKDASTGNFDPRKVEAADVPHITVAVVSNAIIIPMKTTSIDMLAASEYYLPLSSFKEALRIKKLLKYNVMPRILPSMIEKGGLGLRELENFKDETGFDFFDVEIRRSEKIANNVNYLGIDTVFTTNVASAVLHSFFDLTQQVFTDVNSSLEG